MAILEANNLNIGYRNGKSVTKVVSDINLCLNEGELVCLLGANGKGKSTLVYVLE